MGSSVKFVAMEQEQGISEKLDLVLRELREIHALLKQPRKPEREVVDAKYVAALLGCSTSSIYKGYYRTNEIPRLPLTQMRFMRRDVERFIQDLSDNARSPIQRADDIFRRPRKLLRRKSILKK